MNTMDGARTIQEFVGDYQYLSNFSNYPVRYNGINYMNSEAAFQAQKDPSRAHEFSKLNPSQAKALGRKVKLRVDWEAVKEGIMYEIVSSKFAQNIDIQRELHRTYPLILVEGNNWGDTYWGFDFKKGGQNRLGNILMTIRDRLVTGKHLEDFQ